MTTTVDDHYYWLTSMLAARGQQARTSRAIAAMNAGLGFAPVMLLASPMGPRGPVRAALAVAIAIVAIGIATLWLSHAWPSRRSSEVSVACSSIAVSVGCLIMSSPLLGLFGAVSFVFTTIHIAVFHHPRLLLAPWGLGAVTVLVLTVRMGTHDPVLAVAGAGLAVLVNVFVYYTCRQVIDLSVTDVHHSEIESLTGLLNSDGFYTRTANLLAARNRQDDRHLVLVVVSIDSYDLLVSLAGRKQANQVRVEVSQALRETVRRNAIAAHITKSDFIIADTFTAPDASPLIDRVQGAMRSTPSRVTASIGVVCTPLAPLTVHPPDLVVDRLLAAANGAVTQVREAGGNDVRYDIRKDFPIDE